MKSMLDSSQNIQQFGIQSYEAPSTERLWKKPWFGKSSKDTIKTFADVEQKKKGYIPGSPHYKTEIGDWAK